jgi:uncharacterized protein
MMLPYLYVSPSLKGGRGVFTDKNIKANTVLEIAPVLLISSKDRKMIEQTNLTNYIFEWGARHRMAVLALGYVSLYNHDYASNCDYEMDFDSNTITIKAIKTIKKGEELCINYNANPNDKTKVWFDK